MSKIKDSIDKLTPMEAYQKGYADGQDVGYDEYKRGIREVVGLLDKPCPHTGGIEEQQMRAIDCPKCWQAKLKEWGIK